MKVLIIFLLMHYSLNLWASEKIFFRSDSLSPRDFKSMMLAEDGVSYAEYQIEARHNLARNAGIDVHWKKFLLATKNKSAENIFSSCQNLVQSRYDQDWPEVERMQISKCLKLLTKYSITKEQSLSWSNEAKYFNFQNKTYDEFVEVKIPEWILGHYEALLINGQRVSDLESKILVPAQKFRISLFSSAYPPITDFIDANELKNYSTRPSPLIRGNCIEGFNLMPTFIRSIKNKQIYVLGEGTGINPNDFPGEDCRVAINDLKPGTEMETQIELTTADNKLGSKSDNKIDKTNFISKVPKWVWWGLGGLVTYSVISNSQNDSADHNTSTKRGF